MSCMWALSYPRQKILRQMRRPPDRAFKNLRQYVRRPRYVVPSLQTTSDARESVLPKLWSSFGASKGANS